MENAAPPAASQGVPKGVPGPIPAIHLRVPPDLGFVTAARGAGVAGGAGTVEVLGIRVGIKGAELAGAGTVVAGAGVIDGVEVGVAELQPPTMKAVTNSNTTGINNLFTLFPPI
jgi:hypothetical protein